jgi:hypothetical protein
MARVRTKAGSVLTSAKIDRLADEAEKGYDLTKAKRVRTGRPSLGAQGESPRVQVRLDPGLAKALRSRARRERRSVSDVAREALRQYLERS